MEQNMMEQVTAGMAKVDWKQKLSSRKFLTMVGLVVILLVVALFEEYMSTGVLDIIDLVTKGCWIWMGTEGGVDIVRILSQAFVDKAKAENSVPININIPDGDPIGDADIDDGK